MHAVFPYIVIRLKYSAYASRDYGPLTRSNASHDMQFSAGGAKEESLQRVYKTRQVSYVGLYKKRKTRIP